MTKHVFLTLAAIFLLIGTSSAATVYLKNGSAISGTIVSGTALEIQIQTTSGLSRVATDQILRIDYSSSSPSPTFSPETPPTPSDSAPFRNQRQPREEFPFSANPENFNQEFSLNLGLATPLSRINLGEAGGGSGDNGDTGILLGSQYLYQTSPHVSWGVTVEFMNRSRANSTSLLPLADTSVSGGSFLLMPSMKYSFAKTGWTRPYLLLGVGTNRTSTIIDAQPELGWVWDDTETDEVRTLVDERKWGLATTARIGIEFRHYDPSFFSFELGWTGLSNGRYSATRAGKDLGLNSVSGNSSHLTFAGRWGWRF